MDNLSEIIPLLNQFGLSPEQLGPERLSKLMELSSYITDPSKLTEQKSAEILRTIGITGAPPKQAPKEHVKKIKRNELCPCGSNKKYKKCCLN